MNFLAPILFVCLSLAAFVLYGFDKLQAKCRRNRIPETMLLALSFFGGAAGGLMAMLLFRHKTRHTSFWIVNFLGILWQATILVLFNR